jgi:hypothetical protein
MSRELVMALCPLVASCLTLPVFAGEADSKKAAELAWAKGVAEDFLDAAFAGKGEQAQALVDSSLKSVLAKEGEQRLGEWLNNSIAIKGFHDPVIRTEAIAPDQDEAAFKGTFQKGQKPMQFSLRVVKDKESGKWRVSYFQFREQDEEK